MIETEFFTKYGEASRYEVQEVIGKGSYGIVGSEIDTHTGERIAIKKTCSVKRQSNGHWFWVKRHNFCHLSEEELRRMVTPEHYTPAIDIWSIGCIFAEFLTRKPLFPGKNVVHQLDLMTDLFGTPPESFAKIRNKKARRYLK